MTVTTPGSEDQAERIRGLQRSLKQIRPEVTYFALTLRDSHGRLERSVQSHFAGFPEGVGPGEGIELREASQVYPDKMTRMWEDVGHDWIVVNDVAQLRVFVLLGGHALIAEGIARGHFADLVKPHLCMSKGAVGFMRYHPDAPDSMVRSRRKQKRRIFERDGHRCQRCGAPQADDARTRLEAHHIRPFSKGGPTADPNLITLCRGCNQSIGDGFEPDLYWAAGGPIASGTDTESAEAHREAVENYRRRVERMLRDLTRQ
ncbi:HNH endonuclease [Candidatus Poriferisodalis sp.]|uniref:HNH endonuclease n=1 Tax=Candidatus Poriferisodalis sp. TaxID=3101277 RepID=UPI003B5BE824